jgi:hypothetical protein
MTRTNSQPGSTLTLDMLKRLKESLSSPAQSAGTSRTTSMFTKPLGSVIVQAVNRQQKSVTLNSVSDRPPKVQLSDISLNNKRLLLSRLQLASLEERFGSSEEKKVNSLRTIQGWYLLSGGQGFSVQSKFLSGPLEYALQPNELLFPCTTREYSVISSVEQSGGSQAVLTTNGMTTQRVTISSDGFSVGMRLSHFLDLHLWKILSTLYGFVNIYIVLQLLGLI